MIDTVNLNRQKYDEMCGQVRELKEVKKELAALKKSRTKVYVKEKRHGVFGMNEATTEFSTEKELKAYVTKLVTTENEKITETNKELASEIVGLREHIAMICNRSLVQRIANNV